MKKTIAIPGWSTGENSFGVSKPYLEYFSQFGQVEILTPKESITNCDLLVLPGGLDTNPLHYNAVPGFYTSNQDVFKEYFFKKNLPQYIEAGIPIFGICLGFQQICTYFGSKLTQHMYHPYSDSRDERVHVIKPVRSYDESISTYIVSNEKKSEYKVNSLHHQAVSQYDLANSLTPLYLDEDSYFVEVVSHKTLPIMGVQYHPEELYCELSAKYIKKLLKTE